MQCHLIKYVKGFTADQPAILIYDGNRTHVSISIIEWARVNNIIVLVLPSHCSHLLQPLSIFFYNSCNKYTRDNNGPIPKRNIVFLVCLQLRNIHFSNVNGSFPFYVDVFLSSIIDNTFYRT